LVDSLVTSYTVTVTGGTTYLFKVRSHNIYGYGAFSNELTVVASDVPDAMTSIVTSIGTGPTDTKVKFAWTPPTSNHQTIDQYEIKFLKSDSSYATDANCDGNDVTIKG